MFFFASKHMGKIKGKKCGFGTLFCPATVLTAHGFPKHFSERAGRMKPHATRYHSGGLTPENGRFSPAPRMARAG